MMMLRLMYELNWMLFCAYCCLNEQIIFSYFNQGGQMCSFYLRYISIINKKWIMLSTDDSDHGCLTNVPVFLE